MLCCWVGSSQHFKGLQCLCLHGQAGQKQYFLHGRGITFEIPMWTYLAPVHSKVIPLQALCGPEGGQRYSSTLPLPRHQKGVSGQQHAPAVLYPQERPGTHFTGGWVGPRAGLNGRKISSPPGFDPDRPARSSFAIPTEVPGPHCAQCITVIHGMKHNLLRV